MVDACLVTVLLLLFLPVKIVMSKLVRGDKSNQNNHLFVSLWLLIYKLLKLAMNIPSIRLLVVHIHLFNSLFSTTITTVAKFLSNNQNTIDNNMLMRFVAVSEELWYDYFHKLLLALWLTVSVYLLTLLCYVIILFLSLSEVLFWSHDISTSCK